MYWLILSELYSFCCVDIGCPFSVASPRCPIYYPSSTSNRFIHGVVKRSGSRFQGFGRVHARMGRRHWWRLLWISLQYRAMDSTTELLNKTTKIGCQLHNVGRTPLGHNSSQWRIRRLAIGEGTLSDTAQNETVEDISANSQCDKRSIKSEKNL